MTRKHRKIIDVIPIPAMKGWLVLSCLFLVVVNPAYGACHIPALIKLETGKDIIGSQPVFIINKIQQKLNDKAQSEIIEKIIEKITAKGNISKTAYRLAGDWVDYEGLAVVDAAYNYIVEIAAEAHNINANIEKIKDAKEIKTDVKQIDSHAPETVMTIQGMFHNNGVKDFASADYAYRLNASDDVSGVRQIEYALDGLNFQVYQGLVKISTEGDHVIIYRAVDNFGNQEENKALLITVDAAAPETKLELRGPSYNTGEGLLVSAKTVFTLSVIDPGQYPSGIQYVQYRINGLPVGGQGGLWENYSKPFTLADLEDGGYTIEYRSADNVNNTKAVNLLSVVLDKTLPETKIISPQNEDGDANIYVADTRNNRIQKFNLGQGAFINGEVSIIGCVEDKHLCSYVLEFAQGTKPDNWTQLKQGSESAKAGEMIVWDTTGLSGIYTVRLTAVDYANNTNISAVVVSVGEPEFSSDWGSLGTAPGQLQQPVDIAADREGYIYVADTMNHRIQKFDAGGNFIFEFGQKSKKGHELKAGGFNQPEAVAVDKRGNIFVADRFNHRIQKFDSEGKYLMEFGTPGAHAGDGDGEFDQPTGVAFDSEGNIYAADSMNQRIQKFDRGGKFLMKFGREGDGDGEFNQPGAISIDSQDNIYVLDRHNNRVQKFDKYGSFLMKFGVSGEENGRLKLPHDICLDSQGNIYVADEHNNRICKFDPYGKPLLVFGSKGFEKSKFKLPCGVALGIAENAISKSKSVIMNVRPEPGTDLEINKDAEAYSNLVTQGQDYFSSIQDMPDLKALGLKFSKADSILEKGIKTVSGEVVSLGSDAENVVVRFYDADPVAGGRQIGAYVLMNLKKDQPETVRFDWDTAGYEGNYYIYAVMDPDNKITETDENNNSVYEKIFIPSQRFTLDVDTDKQNYKTGGSVYVSLRVSNISLETVKGLGCRINIKNGEGNLMDELPVIETGLLIPGEIAFYAPIWDVQGNQAGAYQIEVILQQSGKEILNTSKEFRIE